MTSYELLLKVWDFFAILPSHICCSLPFFATEQWNGLHGHLVSQDTSQVGFVCYHYATALYLCLYKSTVILIHLPSPLFSAATTQCYLPLALVHCRVFFRAAWIHYWNMLKGGSLEATRAEEVCKKEVAIQRDDKAIHFERWQKTVEQQNNWERLGWLTKWKLKQAKKLQDQKLVWEGERVPAKQSNPGISHVVAV